MGTCQQGIIFKYVKALKLLRLLYFQRRCTHVHTSCHAVLCCPGLPHTAQSLAPWYMWVGGARVWRHHSSKLHATLALGRPREEEERVRAAHEMVQRVLWDEVNDLFRKGLMPRA